VNRVIVETSTTVTNWGLVREKTEDKNKPKTLSKADKLKNTKTKSSVIVYLLYPNPTRSTWYRGAVAPTFSLSRTVPEKVI